MNYIEHLKQKATEHNNIVSLGLDPDVSKIPIQGEPKESITTFFLNILEGLKNQDTLPASVKPNIAFYEQYGFEGLQALKTIITEYKNAGISIILDAKRGDIGNTSAAYAKSCFDFWGADAVTVAPYMGSDSVGPFFEYCKKGKGVYVLTRTSNKGAVDFQNLEVEGKPLYMHTAQKLIDWYEPGVSSVIGATYPKELEEINTLCNTQNKEIPFLIPGVGAQGGSATEIKNILKDNLAIHRINSSRGILYAYQKQDTDDYVGASVKALKELNKEINF